MEKQLLLALTFLGFLHLTKAQPGQLDPSFGTNGIVKTNIGQPYNYGGTPAASDVLSLADGSMYVIQNSLTKRRANGALDSSFGINDLIESAWTAKRTDPAMSLYFQEQMKRKDSNIVIIKIARKLLNRIRYVLVNQTAYEYGIVK